MTQLLRRKLSSAARKLLDEADPSKFAWARLAGTPPEIIDEASLFETFPIRLRLLTDVANLRDAEAVSWFWKHWAGRINLERKQELLQLRDDLRAIWKRPDSPSSQEILDSWLVWTPSQAQMELDGHFRGGGVKRKAWDYLAFRCSLRACKLIPNLHSLRAMLVQGILEHWHHFRYCASRECLAPYFIAKRRDQTVCDSEACKASKQREHALKWWNENRAKKVSMKAAKGRSKNGTHKTR
jgi:hypothetical protein